MCVCVCVYVCVCVRACICLCKAYPGMDVYTPSIRKQYLGNSMTAMRMKQVKKICVEVLFTPTGGFNRV
jgi:hypothetical protein